MLLMLSAFSLDAVAYAFVGQLLYVSCMNHIVFNLGPKLYEVEIICDQPQEIERFIIQDIRKSATIDQVVGSYSGAVQDPAGLCLHLPGVCPPPGVHPGRGL